MKQFLDFLIEFWPMLISGVLSVAAAVAGIISALNARRFSKYLEDAKKRETYVVCPYCRKKIPLSQITFHLPSGEVDNDLNGKPDHISR